MKNPVFVILFLSAFLISCEKSNMSGEYPTTYKKLSASQIAKMRQDYFNRNQFIQTSLNVFGFCDLREDLSDTGIPSCKGDISQSQAISIIKDFISNNKAETGVRYLNNLEFYYKSKEIGTGGNIFWNFRSANQRIDSIEIMNSMLLFHLVNDKVIICHGNWYPEIYVPDNFKFSQAKSKSLLIGKDVYHYSWGGGYVKYTISKTDLESSEFRLKILPKEFEDRIELRVVWQIYIPDADYKMYVDVITGEILMEEPTVIS